MPGLQPVSDPLPSLLLLLFSCHRHIRSVEGSHEELFRGFEKSEAPAPRRGGRRRSGEHLRLPIADDPDAADPLVLICVSAFDGGAGGSRFSNAADNVSHTTADAARMQLTLFAILCPHPCSESRRRIDFMSILIRREFALKRYTSNFGVPYFVQPSFDAKFSKTEAFREVEGRVNSQYRTFLQNRCVTSDHCPLSGRLSPALPAPSNTSIFHVCMHLTHSCD